MYRRAEMEATYNWLNCAPMVGDKILIFFSPYKILDKGERGRSIKKTRCFYEQLLTELSD